MKFDNVKFFLICCVVLGHLGNRYADKSYVLACAQFWIYLFHMPAFIYVSGLFSKKTINENRWSKIVPYIFLFFGMKMLNFAFAVFSKGIESASVNFFHENGIPWYALSMFWWGAVAILVKRVRPAYVLMLSLFLAVISGYSSSVNSFLVMRRTIVFFPFFYLGYITDVDWLVEKLDNIKFKVVSIIVVAVTVAFSFLYYNKIYYWRYLFRGFKPYTGINDGLPYSWGWSWRIAAYLISAILTLAIICLTPSIKSFISSIGKKTLSVFVFHDMLISLSLFKVKWFKQWMLAGNISVKCIVFMSVIVLVTSLPLFDIPLRKLMTVPMREE